MKLCSKCKKRPAVVFISNPADPTGEPEGLCLSCAKDLGIKPVDDMLKSMNVTDEDIEQLSNQFIDLMGDVDDEALNDGTFDLGTAPAIPFIKNLFGGQSKSEEQSSEVKTEKGEKNGEKQ